MISAFVTGVVSALLLASALVYDGGQVLAARRSAVNAAATAARVGAQELDLDALYRGDGVRLDVARSEQAAVDAAERAGARRATARVEGDRVVVEVEFPDQSLLLGAMGVAGRVHVRAGASARLARGVEGETR